MLFLLFLLPSLVLSVRLSIVDRDRIDIITVHYPSIDSLEYLTPEKQWVNASYFIDSDDNRILSLAGLNWVAVRAHITTRDAEGFQKFDGMVTAVAPLVDPLVNSVEIKPVYLSYALMAILVAGAVVIVSLSNRKRELYVSEKERDKRVAEEEFYR
jgi:hypothetical protein